MLVLGRRIGQKVMIGKDSFVTVTSIRGDLIGLGFSFPREVNIMREELTPKKDDDEKYYDNRGNFY